MTDYVATLRQIESKATPDSPMPALDRIMHDHRAGEGKTLSVFVRDCVKGNCFPIDSRVRSRLTEFGLPNDERSLVSLCLSSGLNPAKSSENLLSSGGYLMAVENSTLDAVSKRGGDSEM